MTGFRPHMIVEVARACLMANPHFVDSDGDRGADD
jgi:hypothetical protein